LPGDYSLATTLAAAVFSPIEIFGRPASRPWGVFDHMELKLYDTLTREKRTFKPIDPNNVRMYVCGPTVYDFAHIGNARPMIVFDVLFRLLRHIYGADHVTYARNITDVDDKINARAAERNITIKDLTDETYNDFKADVAALGCLEPTYEPRATEFIRRSGNKTDIVRLIEELHRQEYAYVEQDHVLFHVPSMRDYGMLSRRSLDEMIVGARVEVAPYKRNPLDFVLWKPSDERQANYPLPKWESPCGIATPGRPGWHIECSAMSAALLGETFDIHGGGIDLVFPHHENEIAQSRCAFHSKFMANYWVHNGFLQVEGRKMAKSEGNFVTIRDLVSKWPGDVLRLQMLMTHYHHPIDWTESNTLRACAELEEWSESLLGYSSFKNPHDPTDVIKSLADDLNTPNAITTLRDLHAKAKRGRAEAKLIFAANCRFLGFRNLDKPGFFRTGISAMNVGGRRLLDYEEAFQKLRAAKANKAPQPMIDQILAPIHADGLDVEESKSGDLTLIRGDSSEIRRQIERLVEARMQARKAKDFKESDRIRDELAKMGVVLKDTKDGTTWEIAR
jgi:cysteinyl-tRNA synthetase